MSTRQNDDCYNAELLSVDDAIEQLLGHASSVTETESVSVLDALGRVLAADIVSTIDVPGHDNTAMDGYALRAEDCAQSGGSLKVTQRIPAGSNGVELKPGEAARIFTGAPIPPGADVVVMQEKCEQHAGSDCVKINAVIHPGENIRRAGEDIKQGSVILKSGTRLRQQELGLIASVGVADVPVFRQLRVACFFTGDELVAPGNTLQSGQIYNSNRYTLNGFLQRQDCVVDDFGTIPDSLDATLDVIHRASQTADLILTSGGVSVGEEDYVRIALEQLGKLELWRIAMKPGKPVAFGRVGDALFLGLPGNPVSVFVTAQVFARPVIRRMQGESQHLQTLIPVKSGFEWPAVKRQEYLRARLEYVDGATIATIYPKQGSGVLSSASWADGLVIVPVDEAITLNSEVAYMPFE